MQRIACGQCGTTVLAEKYSQRHTSVQWLGEAEPVCQLMQVGEVRRAGTATGSAGTICPALHSTIDDAARSGLLPLTRRCEPTPGVLQ